jgi:hypothetical protein
MPNRGNCDRQEFAGEGERGAVEVAARPHAPVRHHDRVVHRALGLGRGDAPRMGHRIAGRANDRRGAARRVGVLDAIVAVAVARHDRRAGQQPPQVRGAVGLPWVRAQRDEVLRERHVGGAHAPRASATSPSPSSTSAQCASGARSPLAPSGPC